jgi:hypothetical protein
LPLFSCLPFASSCFYPLSYCSCSCSTFISRLSPCSFIFLVLRFYPFLIPTFFSRSLFHAFFRFCFLNLFPTSFYSSVFCFPYYHPPFLILSCYPSGRSYWVAARRCRAQMVRRVSIASAGGVSQLRDMA